MAKAPKTDPLQLNSYLEARWQLIPLHKWNYFDEHKGKKRERGKSPMDGNWTRKPYKSKEQIAHMEKGSNVGVRLRAEDLVIDVDPRNFKKGDDPFLRLCEDCGINPDKFPKVETGSGGLHVYMKKPADVSVRDSLPDYEGVEFKTLGRQVVSAGSIHPTTRALYNWDFLGPDLKDAGPAPTMLLNLIRRPARSLATGGGEHTQEELATMLDALDPEDFRDHDAWFTLMQACHHATAGDGRSEFVEWSTRDPEYTDHGGLIGRRWDSLHADNDGGARVTYRTLHKILLDSGQEAAIPRAPAADDFEAVGPEDLPDDALIELEEHEKKGPLERMNDKYWAVMDGGQFRVMWEEVDHETGIPEKEVAPRKKWIKARIGDFHLMLANRKVQSDKKAIPLSQAWIEWGGRRSAAGVVFDPERDHEGFLNLWTGWGIQPRKKGSWEILRELLSDNLCDGDTDVYNYVMDWAAFMVQHPAKPAEVAICFQGGNGIGKGTWGRTLANIAGKHGMQITSSDQLTGRFNDHLRDVILLFADEAIKPYDKSAESRLKGLITEPRLAFEGKGKDIISGRNMLHIVMASNEDWFIPATFEGERRFMMQRANNGRKGQHAWFDKLNDQLAKGGLSALLWELLERDISGWSPRMAIPSTKAFIEQKLRNMSPVQQWWFNALVDGNLPFETTRDDADWSDDFPTIRVRAFKQDVRESFEMWCRQNGIKHPGAMGRSNEILFAEELRSIIPGFKSRNVREPVPEERPDIKITPSDGRAAAFEFGPLTDCREMMSTKLGGEVAW